ncbi:MAG: helix-turn-helix transcriptional regulator [Lentisphaeria bacterium]|jgi:DNA-binding XRE family transcriptional regulator|nr:helix-turn-helix transcriptional regulator [Lentisphaeria bacterium]
MKKKRQEDWTEEEIAADIAAIAARDAAGIPDEDEVARDAYFTDPANAEEVNAMFERFRLREELYKARREAKLTQKELARRMGTSQTYIAAVEHGKKNITFSTLARYARACGKKVALI